MHKVRQYIIYIENVIYTNIIELTMISAFFYSLKTRQKELKINTDMYNKIDLM
jgi:hypothetical protein